MSNGNMEYYYLFLQFKIKYSTIYYKYNFITKRWKWIHCIYFDKDLGN